MPSTQLGELVYVELPEAGRVVKAGEACAVVESVKAASDVYAPMGGTVSGVNAALDERAGPGQYAVPTTKAGCSA